jgi:hypothetical protein
MLQDFLADSGLGHSDADKTIIGNGKTRRRGAAGIKTEGVLVSCQTSAEESVSASELPPSAGAREASEGDEFIWWAWDGKLTGFAEW